jgi:hypothetical protein
MIDTTILDGIIHRLARARRLLRGVGPGSPHAGEVAELVAETEGLLARLESLRAPGDGREPRAA